MTFEQIKKDKNNYLKEKLEYDFYENRFDIRYGDDYDLYNVNGYAVPVHIDKPKGFFKVPSVCIGNALSSWNDETANNFYDFLFNKYQVKSVKIFCSKTPAGKLLKYCKSDFSKANYAYIDLPNTKTEFDSRLSKRVRYNTKWYPKKIKEEICDYKIECFDVKDKIQQENICNIFKCFFEWKKKTHNKIYKQTPNEYIKQFSITHCYSLSLSNKTNEMCAVGFIVDTGKSVYFNNCSFNQDEKYRKYSFGMVLFYHIICDLIEQNKDKFYLGRITGSNMEYKKHYNATIVNTYTGSVPRPHKVFFCILYILKRLINKNK